MFVHDLFDVLFTKFSVDFVHCLNDVLNRHLPSSIRVKLFEYRFLFVFWKELLDIQCCCQELGVVDLFIALIVYLLDYLLDFLIWNRVVSISDGSWKFLECEKARAILVKLHELWTKVFYFLSVEHLHQHIHACFLQLWDSSVLFEQWDNIWVKFVFFTSLFNVFEFFEPFMLDCLCAWYSLLWVWL